MPRHRPSSNSLRGTVGVVVGIGLAGLAGLAGVTGPTAGAAGDGSSNAELAAAQFRVFLLTNTDLRPSDISCTLPPTTDSSGGLLCFALVNGRHTVAAAAALESPGVYTFTAISKVDDVPVDPGGSPPAPTTTAPPADPQAADQAVRDLLADVVADPAGLQAALVDGDPRVVSVDDLSYDDPTVTLNVTITSNAAEQSGRDEVAFYITDRLALLWEVDQPLRNSAATVHPRLEVIVDGTIYGTPYDVMVGVADFDIGFEEWLEISTGAARVQKGARVAWLDRSATDSPAGKSAPTLSSKLRTELATSAGWV